MSGLRQEKSLLQAGGETGRVRWELNLDAAARAQRWSRDNPTLLYEEAAEMAQFFPYWFLTVAREEKPLLCESCGDSLVWKPQGLACAACDRVIKGNVRQEKLNLAWMGHLPAPIPSKGKLLKRLEKQPNPSAPLVKVGEQNYLLVPLLACYPENWPQMAPILRYDRGFLDWLGIKTSGHTTHLVGADGATMCLYAGWRAITLRIVLQQRVVNHVVSLLKIAQGVSPSAAFLDHYNNDRSWYDR